MNRLWLVAMVSAMGWAQTAPATQPAGQAQATPAPTTTQQAAPGTPPVVPATSQSNAAQAPVVPAVQQTSAATTPKTAAPAAANTNAAAPAGSMAASIALQRAAVMKQVSAVSGKAAAPASSFFTVPWIEGPPQGALPEQVSAPLCDPMPGEQLDSLIEDAAKREGVKADLIRSVIRQESASRPCAVSPKGAQGLMQLMPATVEQFGVRDPFDPRQNVDAGTKLLKQLLEKYGGDITLALSAYNAGSGRVDREGGVPAIPETINYVNGVLEKLPKQ